MSRWSSAEKESTPPNAVFVSRTEMSEIPCGASRREVTRVPVAVGSSV